MSTENKYVNIRPKDRDVVYIVCIKQEATEHNAMCSSINDNEN